MFDVLVEDFVGFLGRVVRKIRRRKVHRVARFENHSARRIYLAGYGRRNHVSGDKTPVISHQWDTVITAGLAAQQLAEDFGDEWHFVELEPYAGQSYLERGDTEPVDDAETLELLKSLVRKEPPPSGAA
jgi:hypothetical protein